MQAKMNKKIVLFAATIILIITLSSVNAGKGLEVKITTAYYTDLDGDGDQYDIYSEVVLELLNGSKNITFTIVLTLPNGSSYTFVTEFSTKATTVTIGNQFFDYATLPGWYTIDAFATTSTPTFFDSDTLVFDPPGGTGGGNPIDPAYSITITE